MRQKKSNKCDKQGKKKALIIINLETVMEALHPHNTNQARIITTAVTMTGNNTFQLMFEK